MTELDPRNSALSGRFRPRRGSFSPRGRRGQEGRRRESRRCGVHPECRGRLRQRRGRSAPRREEGAAHGRHRRSYHLRARGRRRAHLSVHLRLLQRAAGRRGDPAGAAVRRPRHRRLRRGGHGRTGHLAVRLCLPGRAHRPEVQRHRAERAHELGHAGQPDRHLRGDGHGHLQEQGRRDQRARDAALRVLRRRRDVGSRRLGGGRGGGGAFGQRQRQRHLGQSERHPRDQRSHLRGGHG